MKCWVIIHCLEVSCKEDQITSAQREWFIFLQLTDTHWSWSISILTHKNNENTFEVFSFFQLYAIALKNSRQNLDYVAYVYM